MLVVVARIRSRSLPLRGIFVGGAAAAGLAGAGWVGDESAGWRYGAGVMTTGTDGPGRSGATDLFPVVIAFHGDLGFFLKRQERSAQPPSVVTRILNRKASVKEVIEGCGVPHPEVDLILAGGEPANFAMRVEIRTRLDVYPVSDDGPFPSARLQARNVRAFVADGHLGKLVRDLPASALDKLHPQSHTQRAAAYKPIARTVSRANRVVNGTSTALFRVRAK